MITRALVQKKKIFPAEFRYFFHIRKYMNNINNKKYLFIAKIIT